MVRPPVKSRAATRFAPSAGLLLLVWVLTAAVAPPAAAQVAADPCVSGPELYRGGQFVEARTALQECLALSGEDLQILLPLTVMAVREGRLEEGVGYGKRAVEAAPADPEAHYWYGRALLRNDDVEEARAEWEQGLQYSVNHMGILEGLARLALAEDEPAKAYQLLIQMQRQGMDEPWLNRLLADIAADKGLWSQSLVHLEDALAQEDPSTRDLITASELSLLVGRIDAAIGYCRRAVAMEPGPATYGSLGEAFFTAEAVDSALVYLRLAVEQEPDSPRYIFNLANALEVTGQQEEAGAYFRAFIDLVPDDPLGHFNYGVHLDKLGRTEQALAEVSLAIELNPGMLTARVVRAQVLETLGRWDEAIAEVSSLKQVDQANQDELSAWQDRIMRQKGLAIVAEGEGKIHLQHMILGTAAVKDVVVAELASGVDFGALTVHYSRGRAAARGGDIGWINPTEMVEPMKSAILKLEMNEISPPIEAGGLYHIFKRIP